MKQWHYTLFLVLVCAGFAAYCLKFERGELPEGELVFKFDPDNCDKIELTPAQDEKDTTAGDDDDNNDNKKEEKPTVVLIRSGDAWKIEKPFEARADQEKVEQLLNRVKDLEIKNPISDDPELGKLDLADYGLKKPAASLTVHLKKGKPMTLLFGDKPKVDSSKVYTMQKGEKAVFLVGTSVYDDANKKLDDLRDKSALDFEKTLVKKVRLTRKDGSLEIEKKNIREKEKDETDTTSAAKDKEEDKLPEFEYDWWLSKPVKARAEKYDCDNIVTKLDDLKADKWVDNKPTPEKLKEYSLDKPWLKAEVWVAEEKRSRKLFIGKKADGETDKHYAKNSLDKSVFLVAKSILDDLKKEAKDLRDKDVFDFEKDDVEKFSVKSGKLDVMCRHTARGEEDLWQLVRPREMRADKKEIDDILWDLDGVRAEEFLDHPKDDKAYGLDNPRYTVKVWLKGEKAERTLLVGRAVTDESGEGQKRVYVKVKGEDTVYEVSDSIVKNLNEIDDKELRDRTVLKFTRDDLLRIALKHGKTSIELAKSGLDWNMTKPKQQEANSTTVSDLLWKFEDFHADEYVGEAPKNLKKYGFDKPQAEVTFYLKGTKPKTVLLGKPAKDEKVYVMLKGGKSVFRHKDSLVDDVQKEVIDFKKSPMPATPGAPPY